MKQNYNITENNGIYSINQTEIQETIFNEELFNYRIIEREEIINDLIGWIAEGNKDKELMIDDLKYLMNQEDVYLFSSIETNEYVLKSDNEKDFNLLCEELLELNKTLDNPLICNDCKNTTTNRDKKGCVCNKCKRGIFKEVEE